MPDRVLDAIEQLRLEISELRRELRQSLEGDPNELLTPEAAAKLLHVSTGAVRQAIYRRKLPASRIGRRLRIRRGDIIKR